MSSSANHDQLRNEILLCVGSSGIARVWPNETGLVRSYQNPARVIRIGMSGAPDILGILQGGFWLGIEVKTGTGKLNKNQVNFRRMIEKFGGIYILGHNVEQVMAEIKAGLQIRLASNPGPA